MKKIIALLSAITLMAGTVVFAYASEDYLGDTNKDGDVDSSDALEILEYSVGKRAEIDKIRADITKDGEINSLDALDVLCTSVGILDLLPIENAEEPSDEPGEEPGENPGDNPGEQPGEKPEEPPVEPVKDPLEYSEAEIIEMYNKAVTDSYKQTVTVKSASNVSISLNSITGGDVVKSLANSIIEKNAAPTNEEKTFTDGKASDGTKLNEFAACAGIDFDGVKKASIKKNGNGYEIEFTVVSETATVDKAPKYNSQCSKPLDLNSIDLMGATVTKADFSYTGTVIKAVIDENGKIKSTDVTMPLAVVGEGKLSLIKIKVDANGVYTNSSVFTY